MNLADALEFAGTFGPSDPEIPVVLLVAGALADARQRTSVPPGRLFAPISDPLGYDVAPLRLWGDPRAADRSEIEQHLAAGVDLWDRSVRIMFAEPVADDLEAYLRASITGTEVVAFSHRRQIARPVRPWGWPVRLAVPLDLRAQLVGDSSWSQELIVPVDPFDPHAAPHLVVGDAAQLDEWAASRTCRAGLAVVVAAAPPTPFADEVLAGQVGGWIHLPVASDPIEATLSIVYQLSHNWALDEAVAIAARGDPYSIVAPPGLVARTRITDAIASAADAQARVHAIDLTRTTRRPTRTRRRRGRSASSDAARLPSIADGYQGRPFDHESHDATDAARDIASAQHATANREDRFLTADVQPGPPQMTGARAQLSLWIAPLGETGAAIAPDAFSDDVLPWDGVALPLEVVIFELADGGFAGRQTIELPPRGASTHAEFDVQWDGGRFAARAVVLHEKRFVQSMLLTIDEHPLGVRLERECVVRPANSDLTDATPHDAAIVLNDRNGTLVGVTTPAGEQIRAPANLDRLRRSITDLLKRVIDEPDAFDGLGAEKFTDLLVDLAKFGTTLREVLFTGQASAVAPGIYAALDTASRISVLSAVPTHILPLELVYGPTFAPPLGTRGTVCQTARDVLAMPEPNLDDLRRRCAHTSATGDCGADASKVCPLGFWGLQKVIERHTNRGLERRTLDQDYAVSASPSLERFTVDISDVLAAATPKADANPAESWSAARTALTNLLHERLLVLDDWPAIISNYDDEATHHGLLLLVPHVDKDPSGQLILDIGVGPPLGANDVRPQFAPRFGRDTPIVLLLGCTTGSGESPTEEFPGGFLDAGASAVLATMTLVRGRFVADIANALVHELLADIRAQGEARLGDALLRVRQRLLARNPLVLSLVAYGDADWTLVARQT